MDKTLKKSYEKIFKKEPDVDLKDWELAQKIVGEWNVPALGEDLAKETIFKIVNHISFPNGEKTVEIVGKAEEMATELFEELENVDPHMDVIAELERRYWEKKLQDQNKEMKIR